jgi:hypothetical protein
MRIETHLNLGVSVRYVCPFLIKIGMWSSYNETIQYQKSRKSVQPLCEETHREGEANRRISFHFLASAPKMNLKHF